MSLFVSSPKMALLFAKLFAERIKKKRNKNGVFIFSPSPKGGVLALWTAYLLKKEGINVYFDVNILKRDKDLYKVAIDTSIDTGFTLTYKWCIERNKKFDETEIQNIEKEFDILTIVKREGEELVINKSLWQDI